MNIAILIFIKASGKSVSEINTTKRLIDKKICKCRVVVCDDCGGVGDK